MSKISMARGKFWRSERLRQIRHRRAGRGRSPNAMFVRADVTARWRSLCSSRTAGQRQRGGRSRHRLKACAAEIKNNCKTLDNRAHFGAAITELFRRTETADTAEWYRSGHNEHDWNDGQSPSLNNPPTSAIKHRESMFSCFYHIFLREKINNTHNRNA